MAAIALSGGCATKEDYDPSLAEKPILPEPPPPPIYRFSDSPSCLIPVNNLLHADSILPGGGGSNEISFDWVSWKSSYDYLYSYNTTTNSSIGIYFYTFPETGIYTTDNNVDYALSYPPDRAMVMVYNFPYTFLSYPDQKISVNVNPETGKMSVKFCELKFHKSDEQDTVKMTCRLTNQ